MIPSIRLRKSAKKKVDPNFGITNNNPVDIHVGKRIRLRRTLLGYSQEQLADGLNITFQQVQKYERGSNRVSASRLWDISQLLAVDIAYFFEEMSKDTRSSSPRQAGSDQGGVAHASDLQMKDPMARRETLELVRSYYSIENPRIRKRLAEVVKTVAQAAKGE